MKKSIIHNCNVFDGNRIHQNCSILIQNDYIKRIGNGLQEKDAAMVDAKGALIAPGFIDLQINGGGGVLFTDEPTSDSLRIISKAHEKYGVLNYLPTLISTDLGTIKKAIVAVSDYSANNTGVLGLHMEGPYLELSKAGIHDASFIHHCSLSELNNLYENYQNVIKIMTVAPEACNRECITSMINHGTKVFIGHSNATYSTAKEFFDYGVSGFTHLYNAMSQIQGREPGIVGACFDIADPWAGIIADGFHVDFASIRIAKKNKGNRLFLVTDAMPPVGIGNFDYCIGETKIHCKDGKCTSASGTIAGSALNMNEALKNAVYCCDIKLDEALRMTSTYQAQLLGIEDRLGYIKEDNYADLIALNDELDVIGIVKRGEFIEWNV